MLIFLCGMFFVCTSSFSANLEADVFSLDLMPGFADRKEHFTEKLKKLDCNELQLLKNFLYLSTVVASADLSLHKNLALFMQSIQGLTQNVNDYEASTHVVCNDDLQEHLHAIHTFFEQRNKAYALWKAAEKQLDDDTSGKLAEIAGMIQDHGQEVFLQCADKCREKVRADIAELDRANKLLEPSSEIKRAAMASRLIGAKELDQFDMLNMLYKTSQGYCSAAFKSFDVANYLKGQYIKLSQEYSYYFYNTYYQWCTNVS